MSKKSFKTDERMEELMNEEKIKWIREILMEYPKCEILRC